MTRYIPLFALTVISFAAAADETSPKRLPTGQEAAAIRSAEDTGLAIYRHDHAAAVATDSASELRAFKKDKRVKGWVTEEHQNQIVVTFIDQTPAALYRVVVSKDGVSGPATALENPAPLTEYESGAAGARTAALSSTFQPCSKSYNSVVLPIGETPGKSWAVYLLPATADSNVVPIGGTYRIETSGSSITSQRGFTRTCIALQTGPKAVGLMISHLLDPIPTEAHVYWSLWAKKPIYVATPPNGTIWMVEGNKIRLVERKAATD